ncbi:MAG TPA: amidohydrolase family protein [Pyrinomonadaceae bacterium]|jgi:5-methylthioadenosine/S-adenosylhomocysteine deaminase|nr:amidohydrolase family protein [Pyrinomonadaceae bacterium]
MITIYSARWVLPVSSAPIEYGAVAVDGPLIVGVGSAAEIAARFPDARVENFGFSAILPGLVNAHTHLELTALRGYLENEESDFFAWLRKLTLARLERMTADDIRDSATWGACEAVRAGITCVGDASDSAMLSMRALQDVGLRGVVFQESFGPDARLAQENFAKLQTKVAELREIETELVRVGVSPHAPYTVSGPQLELIANFAQAERLPLMMHAAESQAEDDFLRQGRGLFADGLARRGIDWTPPGISAIQYLKRVGILDCQPLLAHCIRVDQEDIETLRQTGSKVAHCPKSNAKLRHGRAPLGSFLDAGVVVGIGSDSVAGNNTCDIIEEARFACLFARTFNYSPSASQMLAAATTGGAHCLGFESGIGVLSEGSHADLVVVRMDGTHQVPVYDPVTALLFSSSGRDVVLTIIAGREVYRDRRVIGVDEERLRARLKEIARKLINAN